MFVGAERAERRTCDVCGYDMEKQGEAWICRQCHPVEEPQGSEERTKTATWKYCVCEACGYSEEHTAGDPCQDHKCPECGEPLKGANEKPEKKGASGNTGLPLADEGHAWDGPASAKRLRDWAGGPDKDDIDWGRGKSSSSPGIRGGINNEGILRNDNKYARTRVRSSHVCLFSNR